MARFIMFASSSKLMHTQMIKIGLDLFIGEFYKIDYVTLAGYSQKF